MNTAGGHKHGTTSEAPLRWFNEIEKAYLHPLQVKPFQLFEICLVKVHPDCHMMITGSFYSVSFVYIG